jgi:hypothetical protein
VLENTVTNAMTKVSTALSLQSISRDKISGPDFEGRYATYSMRDVVASLQCQMSVWHRTNSGPSTLLR